MDLFDALGEPIRTAFAARRDTLPRALYYSPDAVAGARCGAALRRSATT